MTYQYHDALDRFEAKERAQRAEVASFATSYADGYAATMPDDAFMDSDGSMTVGEYRALRGITTERPLCSCLDPVHPGDDPDCPVHGECTCGPNDAPACPSCKARHADDELPF